MEFAKYRIRFRKGGDLRLLSHHDLMRSFERMLRRAALPFRSTEGFHPHPRLVFALSLPLGVIGAQEVVELELTEDLPGDDVLARLCVQAPPGLELLSINSVAPRVTAQVCRVVYRLAVPPDRGAAVSAACAALLRQPECWVERSRPQPRRVDIRTYLIDLRLNNDALEIDLSVTPTGSARADEVVALLGLTELFEAGAVLERTVLEIQDEQAQAVREPAAASGRMNVSAGQPAVSVPELADC